jgi:hypothetical protein
VAVAVLLALVKETWVALVEDLLVKTVEQTIKELLTLVRVVLNLLVAQVQQQDKQTQLLQRN